MIKPALPRHAPNPNEAAILASRRRALATLAALGLAPLIGPDAVRKFVTPARAATAAAPDIDQRGLTGAWYDASAPGQGFLFETYPDFFEAGSGLFFGAWFTFDTSAGGVESQRWYTLSGLLTEGQSSADAIIYENTGGNFDAAPVTFSVEVGSGTLAFDSCTGASFEYAFDDGRSGTIALSRILANEACTSSDESGASDADFALSGTWYDPETAGQGLLVEINPSASTAFFAWFTYAVDGSGSGESGLRWFTGQTNSYSAGSYAIDLTLYETTGGVFATATSVTTTAVGTATLTFSSCDAATLDYSFTSGELAGRSGSITLSRTGATPSTCMFGTSCALIPEETAGPYPLESVLANAAIVRSDITEDRTGVPLRLTLRLVNVNDGCAPIANAAVYIWHCDKDGVYSGYANQTGGVNAVGEIFLRGVQVSDGSGRVTFATIYPGWYAGRITHIHAQVFLNDALGGSASATTQFAFAQDITAAVYDSTFYAARGQNTSVASFAQDGVFSDGTAYQMLTISGSVDDGYTATLTVGIAA